MTERDTSGAASENISVTDLSAGEAPSKTPDASGENQPSSETTEAAPPSPKRGMIGVPVALGIAAGVLSAAGAQGGMSYAGIPILLLLGGAGFAIQWLAFIPAYTFSTEKFYDLVGSITYLALTWAAVSAAGDGRSLLMGVLISVWAVRLGSFLFVRIHHAGNDRRFDRIKPFFWPFLLAWTLQGLWVVITLAAALTAMTSDNKPALGLFAVIGAAVWCLGFGIEAVADEQKRRFRGNGDNQGRFIQTGLWGWSRHPNYVGEITLWLGVAIIAFPVLQGWQLITLISPVFVFLLLTRISGVPLLEADAQRRWGSDPDYQDYVARTPVLFPGVPGRR